VKTFEDKTYYEILRISEDADGIEIKRAYHEALELYEENSLATYRLFSDEQRAALLQAIQTAYYTLSDQSRRNAYHEQLASSGRFPGRSKANAPETENVADSGSSRSEKSGNLVSWVKTRVKETDIAALIDDIYEKEMISGRHLKQLRIKLDITHSEIYEITRISRSILTMIEEDQYDSLPAEVFLKSFLKSYAEILQIDSYKVVEGYLKSMKSTGIL
jgi:curved DNA-binding protein CbpA